MQHASCIVALNGDITFTVVKPDVTVAEVAILRAIHGMDAVTNIVCTYMDKRSHAEERERLFFQYGSARSTRDEPLVSVVFPSMSKLPVTFRDIGLEIDGSPEETEPEIVADSEITEEKPSRGRPKKVQESLS